MNPTGPAESFPNAVTLEQIAANLAAVRQRMTASCERCGRDPAGVRLLPVSKTVELARIRVAYTAGCRQFGENKVQEARKKSHDLSDLGDIEWSVIGHLQTNKAREVARFAHEFQALDRLSVATELDRRLQAEGRALDVFVQVNTSGEASKYGLAPEETEDFLKQLPVFSSLRVKGLMTLAALSRDETRVRGCFSLLRDLRDRLAPHAPEGVSLHELSMGMSGDFEIAIEEGATIVRIGQAIFGARQTPDSYYWPDASGTTPPADPRL